MRNMTRIFALSVIMSAGLTLGACSDDDPGTSTTAGNTTPTTTVGTQNPLPSGTGTSTDSTGGANGNVVPGCNPVGADVAMSELLNKPVGPTVTVIVKPAAHPNPNVPGPTGLPQ